MPPPPTTAPPNAGPEPWRTEVDATNAKMAEMDARLTGGIQEVKTEAAAIRVDLSSVGSDTSDNKEMLRLMGIRLGIMAPDPGNAQEMALAAAQPPVAAVPQSATQATSSPPIPSAVPVPVPVPTPPPPATTPHTDPLAMLADTCQGSTQNMSHVGDIPVGNIGWRLVQGAEFQIRRVRVLAATADEKGVWYSVQQLGAAELPVGEPCKVRATEVYGKEETAIAALNAALEGLQTRRQLRSGSGRSVSGRTSPTAGTPY